MKDPITAKWFQKEVKPHVGKSEFKNMESHVKSCEKMEKNWTSKPLDETAIKLLNNALNNVEKTLGAVKKPNDALKAAQMKVFKALNDYKDKHNTGFAAKVDAKTIGMIPGGVTALEKIGIKEWSTENTEFRKATNVIKPDDSTKLLKIYKDFRGDINLSNSLFNSYDRTKKKVEDTIAGLKDAAKRGDDATRKILLVEYKKAVKEFHTVTVKARNSIIVLQNDSVTRFKSKLYLH